LDNYINLCDLKLSLIEEQFDIPVGFQGDQLTPITAITFDFKQTSQSLLQSYVQSESHVLVQVIFKNVSVENGVRHLIFVF
jgi:hypothetical protein